jgi:lipoprotein NlpI
MTKAAWLLAGALISSGAPILTGAARAADAPLAPLTDFSRSGMGIRVIPTPRDEPPQSPEAVACANSDGKTEPQARMAACSTLIDARKWKGKEIAWAYANRCAVASRLGQVDRALADCSEAIDQDGELAMAYQLRGEIHRKRDELDKALEDFDRAVALGAGNVALFSARGLLLLLKGDASKALASYEQEVAIAGGAADAWMDLGSAQLGLGEDAKAEQDFARATELDKKNALAWLNRGAAALGAGDKSKAIEYFRESLKRDPAQTYAALWMFVASDGAEPAKAELQAYADKAAKKDWPFPVTQLYLGQADAAQTLGAAKDDDQLCEARVYVAESQLMKGVVQDATPSLKRAAESCPKNFIEYFRAVAELKKLEPAK